jgi:hypothetical protein
MVLSKRGYKMHRKLGAILVPLGLSVALLIGAVATSSPALAASNPCAGKCIAENLYTDSDLGVHGLWIFGDTHGDSLVGSNTEATVYKWVNEDDETWGLMEGSDDLCWNYAGGYVYMDSCQPKDHNEWFWFDETPGGFWLIKNYTLGTGHNLAADWAEERPEPVYFTPGVNDTSTWAAGPLKEGTADASGVSRRARG